MKGTFWHRWSWIPSWKAVPPEEAETNKLPNDDDRLKLFKAIPTLASFTTTTSVDEQFSWLVTPHCRRSNHVSVPEATGVGDHDGNFHRASACEPQDPGRDHDQCSEWGESAAKLGSTGVKTMRLEHNGFHRVLHNTTLNTKVAHARGEDEWSWRLRGEEVDFV